MGYGTLLWRESLGRTVGEEAARSLTLVPVIVRGYRRLYNFAPPHYRPAFRITENPIELSAANVEPAKGAFFNGLAFEAAGEELAALDHREGIYDRVHALLERFESGEPMGTCWIYVGAPDSEFVCRDPGRLLPHWRDLAYARAGAYRIGEAFGKAFDETTFMADGKTPIVESYRDHLLELLSP